MEPAHLHTPDAESRAVPAQTQDARVEEQRRAITDTFGALPNAPEWPDWLAQVRGTGADERLSGLEGSAPPAA